MKILLLTLLVATILLMAKFEAPARHGIARLGRIQRLLPFGRTLHLPDNLEYFQTGCT